MSDTCQPCSSGSSTHTHAALNTGAIWPHLRTDTHTSTMPPSVLVVHILWVNNANTLVGLVYSQSIFLPFIQTSRDVSWKNILSLIKTQLGVTQSSLSSRKNLPSQTLLLKGFRKSHSSLEKLSQTSVFCVKLCWLYTSYYLSLFLSVQSLSCFPLFHSLFLSAPYPPPFSVCLVKPVW